MLADGLPIDVVAKYTTLTDQIRALQDFGRERLIPEQLEVIYPHAVLL